MFTASAFAAARSVTGQSVSSRRETGMLVTLHNEIQYIPKAPFEVHATRCEQVDEHQLTDVGHN